MSSNRTDLTFFTNDANQTLLDRFKATLADTRLFDILVGYFHASGFYQLYDSIEPVEKTRVLVGLGIDDEVYRALYPCVRDLKFDFESHANAKKLFQKQLTQEVADSPESDDLLEVGLRKFIEFLRQDCLFAEIDRGAGGNGKKLEIRAFPSRNIHAKVYIGRFAPEDRDYGFVITGSSNFSYSGLVKNREFNVELRQSRDVDFALEQFEELWRQSVDISRVFVETVTQKTWLNNTITPYELYLKLIYEYMQEDINLQDDIDVFLPSGFMSLKYQKQAVIQALSKLEEHNGVFLSDVVGLGKTFITAQLLQQINGRILVICPPALKDYWEESLHDFRVPARVESLGRLDHVIRFGLERFDYIVVDEAHRFRNEATQSYADLLDICRGKKVILVTATPLNNAIDDIYAQLKLFQIPRSSTIPGIPNLERYFQKLRRKFKGLDRTDPAYKEVIKEVSGEIREGILKHIMVRRTRSDVLTYFREDMEEQGLFFPSVDAPRKVVYTFEGEIEDVFNQTIKLLQVFSYSRYIPLLYYSGSKKLSEFERQQQRNVGGFMKGILIKRLESSIYAFRRSVDRFIRSYERFIDMYEAGTVYISKKVDVYELLDNDDIETLEEFVEENMAQKYAVEDFRSDFIDDLQRDLNTLKKIGAIWEEGIHQDPKIDAFVHQLETDVTLKGQKLIVFSESRETGEYLFEHLNKIFTGEVIFFSSHGGSTSDGNISVFSARELIKAAFDPNCKESNRKLRFLIATDALSEGVNLHEANILINYDLPWNPTRVLQRAGRINRLGTKHSRIFIYNFFPTTQSDAHLGLEANITNKIQMFHNILGEDARYISDGEEIGSQELFDTLNSRKTYSGEGGEGDSELMYLEMMRRIRDEDPELFGKIKLLPKKARSGRVVSELASDQLVTFFRVGKLRKFYCNWNGSSEEITFFDAVRLLECEQSVQRCRVPLDYHSRLTINKKQFEYDTIQVEEPSTGRSGGRSNSDYIEKRLKDKAFRNCSKFTDSDDEFIDGVQRMLVQGTVAKKVAQVIKKEIEKTLDPLEILAVLRKNIRLLDISARSKINGSQARREVILSGYLVSLKDGNDHSGKT